jgi:type III restriction enzyme
VHAEPGRKTLQPILRPYDTVGSTRYVGFDTTRSVWLTRPDKSHINYVVLDSNWEAKFVQSLEEMNELLCYARNDHLGFTIPYTLNGDERSYVPDFIARIHDGRPEPLNLILEVTGMRTKEKAAKASTARTLWVPAVNNHGGFGRWAFLQITDPWNAKHAIRAFLAASR